MKVLIAVLIFISFLQAAVMPVNLVLLILISRSFVVKDPGNYWLAFGFGLFLSLLLGLPLGVLSVAYILMVKIVHSLKATRFSSHWLLLMPLSLALLMADSLLQGLGLFHYSFNFTAELLKVFLVIPVYIIMKFWEERFIPRQEIRLNLGK